MFSKLLITGGSGMVGKNLLSHSYSKKYEILAPSSQELNLLNQCDVFSYLLKHKPDIVVHCAGLVGSIQANIQNPYKFYYKNAEMGFNVVNGSYNAGVKKLINIGSSSMYPVGVPNPLREDFLFTGELEKNKEPYSLAKIAVSKLCEFLCNEDITLKYKTLIPCNLYGVFDKFDLNHSHFIPAAIKKIYNALVNKHSNVEIWGDGKAKRELMFASDFAELIYFTIENLEKFPQNINVGSSQEQSINHYYNLLSEIIGYEGKFYHNLEKPVGAQSVLIDSSQLAVLGWTPATRLDVGLRETFNYFLENHKHD